MWGGAAGRGVGHSSLSPFRPLMRRSQQRFMDYLKYAIRILQNVVVPEAEHLIAFRAQPGVVDAVMRGAVMLAAIGLDD